MVRKTFFLVITICLVLCLSSCKGYRETDSEYYVSTICFDEAEKGFKAYVEVLVISPNDKETRSKVFSATGKTPYDAVSNTTSGMPRTAVFDHCSTAIIGTAVEGEDFKAIIKYLYDTKNLNLGIFMFTSDNIAGILKLKPQTPSVGYDIMNIETNITSNTGVSFKNKYYEICSRQIETEGFCLPVVSEKNKRPTISGETVFRDYSPVITLNKEESLVYNLLYSGSSGGEIKVSNNKCRINRLKTKLKARDKILKITVTCRYRNKSDRKSKALKRDIMKLMDRLYGNTALNVLGVSSFEKIKSAQVVINGK
ncbi:MAG: hypothetical protein J5659_00155 [Clostridia bacterium]|nr:hypothetical protein [Clostridia bacterium]